MDLGRTGESPPRASPPQNDTSTIGGPARPATQAGAGRSLSPASPIPPLAQAPSFLAARARAIALNLLSRLPTPGASTASAAASAQLSASSQAAAFRPQPSSAGGLGGFRQRRLEALAALALEGGIPDAEAESLTADLEARIFPHAEGDASDFPSGGRGRDPSADSGGAEGFDEDASSFEEALSALPGFGGRPRGGAGGSPSGGKSICIPFAFRAPSAAAGGKFIEFRGILRVQCAGGAALRLDADLEAGPSRWAFSLSGGSWRAEREGGSPLDGRVLEALSRRLGRLGFVPAAAASAEGKAEGGLWA